MRRNFARVNFLVATFLLLTMTEVLSAEVTNLIISLPTNNEVLTQAHFIENPPTPTIASNSLPFPSQQKLERVRFIEIIDSKLGSSLIALAVGFLLAQGADRRNKRREEDKKYCCLLESTAQELTFYSEKLSYLSEQLDGHIKGNGIIPSYNYYPKFLEQAKLRLGEFMRRSEIVREVGHCHFELEHICERLVIFKEQAGDSRLPQQVLISNTIGFKNLVDNNISVFLNTAAILTGEAKTVRSRAKIK